MRSFVILWVAFGTVCLAGAVVIVLLVGALGGVLFAMVSPWVGGVAVGMVVRGPSAPNGFVRWRTDWRIRRFSHPDGVVLTITAPDKQEATGWVPVEMIALDLLQAGQRVA